MRRGISARKFEGLRKSTRILLFGTLVLVLTLWLFPLVDTTYIVWSNVDHRWVPFKTTYKREFLTNLQFGEVPYHPYYRDSLLKMAYSRTGYSGQPINRVVGIKWSTQSLQTLLVLGLCCGLLWVMKADEEDVERTALPLSDVRNSSLQGNSVAPSTPDYEYCKGDELRKNVAEELSVSEIANVVGELVPDDNRSPLDTGLAEYKKGNFQRAFDLWSGMAKDGDARALDNLGILFHEGQGVQQNLAEALKLFRQAAMKGLAAAQLHLASMYDFGEGVPSDLSEAAKWYHVAAEQGDVQAQRNIGTMYQQGQGVPQNLASAIRWLKLAADQGDSEAAARLGAIYWAGGGEIKPDQEEGLRWIRIAADRGNAAAERILGTAYQDGGDG